MAWTQANLGGLGDAQLAASCVPSGGENNPDRVICGGITFAKAQYAMSWPGAAVVQNVPTVSNTLPAHVFPASYPLYGPQAGVDTRTPAATPAEARWTGKPLGPATLVAPMPSITPVKPDSVTQEHAGAMCAVSSFAANNPVMAVAAAVGLYMLLRGGR